MSKHLKLPTLLVIADNPSIRFWVKKHLDDQFFVLSAENQQQALEALNARLDFIIIDSTFEECDALDLCKTIAQKTKKNLIPILLITGRLKKSFRDRAVESGVTDFLSDQLDSEELETRIAAGQKSAAARQKTEELGLGIKVPKLNTQGNLKKKFVINDQALRLLAAAKGEKVEMALLLLRIDDFNRVPNREEISPSFSQFIKNHLREKDLLISAGEGVFILLLWNTTPDDARTIAERLQAKIQRTAFGTQHLTTSIALSSLEATETGFQKMIDSATKSLKTHSETNLIISIDPEIE